MHNLAEQITLKQRLPRTWPAFFERHGSFTPVQVAAIPALLGGQNLLICAATASGKTEAALAPLIERHCPASHRPVRPPISLLYLTPTRALANDLAARLAHPLHTLGLTLAVKTHDSGTFRASRPPDLLITTPESADSLLATNARLVRGLRAIVIDELHQFDETPRGDQLRLLLRRIERIRAYAATQGDAPDAGVQLVALSATLNNPNGAAALYLGDAQVVNVALQRAIDAELVPLSPVGSDELYRYLEGFRARGWRKALVFCNSRVEVEAYAADVRAHSPFGNAVYVHYSNIEARRRREIEQQYAEAGAAICFASSTLELGIDIGSIDVVLLIGPPGSRSSFAQRIGRAGRRTGRTQVACFYRTDLERVLFEALLNEENAQDAFVAERAFRPAVAIQQIFSLLKQSPTAALRLAELASLFEGLLSRRDLEEIVGELQERRYLRVGRPGEWRAGPELNELIDSQASAQPGPSIHTNIQGSAARMVEVRDQHTHQTVARVESAWLYNEALTLEGRTLNVEWSDGEVMLVRSGHGESAGERPFFYRAGRQLLSYDLARLLPAHYGLMPGDAPLVEKNGSWLWFHWLGELYGRAALELLRYRVAANETNQSGLCLSMPEAAPLPSDWPEAQVRVYLEDNYRAYEPLLDLGPFQRLLPLRLRKRAVVEQFDIARFRSALAGLRVLQAPEALAAELAELVEE